MCHTITRQIKATNEYMKGYEKNKKSSCLKYWEVNNLCGWAMSQSKHVIGFKWVEETSKCKECFIES